MKINNDEFPIFSGTVTGVPAVITHKGADYTIIDYMAPKDEITEEDRREAMPLGILSFTIEEYREKAGDLQASRIQRAIVPLRADPGVIQGAEIRTRLGEINRGEYGEGHIGRVYELEVIKGRSQAGRDVFAMIAEMGGTPHTGMRYIKFLDID